MRKVKWFSVLIRAAALASVIFLLNVLSARAITIPPAAPYDEHTRKAALSLSPVAPTDVELISFRYEAMVTGVRMAWTARLTDGSASGFHIWRAVAGGRWKLLTPDWLNWDRMRGDEASYNYEDATVYPGTSYIYKLESEEGTSFGPWQVDVPEVDDGGGTVASRHMFMPFLSR